MSGEAVYFGERERARFALLYAADGAAHATGAGLVIVPPFGYEAVCAFRALRVLAERAAAAGVIALQLDLDGTGDSAGDDSDPDRLAGWLASIDDACELVRGSGADRVVLAGVRLGASLATLAAARRRDVAGVIAIAAVPSGRALVREMRALAMASGAKTDDEVIGFALTADTRAALTAIDLVHEPRAPAPAALIIDRDDLKPNDAWVAALRALGCAVTHARLPGYPDMVLDPHHAIVPAAIVDAVVAFTARVPALAHAVPAARAVARLASATHGDVVEQAITLAYGCRAIAASTAGATPRRALVLLNAGAVRRTGPSRLYVALARQLAARGLLVVRVDLSGLGASPPRDVRGEDNVVYGPNAAREVAAITRWLRERGAADVAVAGLCSGAYHALRAAIEGSEIDTVIAINPVTFHYTAGMPIDVQPHKVIASTERYRRSMRSREAWSKLVRGGVDLRLLAHTIARRARDRGAHAIRDVARGLHIPLRDDLGTDLLALAKRGVRVRFVFAETEPGLALLADEAGRIVDQLVARGELAITTIAGADHTFTPRSTHPRFVDAIAGALGL